MKKIVFAFFPWFLLGLGYKGMAQEKDKMKDDKKETEEIVIRKKGSNESNITVQITGDKVLVNGKPLAEFNDDGVTVNKRKIMVRDGDKIIMNLDGDDENGAFAWNDDEDKSGAFLGVTTEKNPEGAKITEEVSKESAAGKAGLQKADIITKFGDTKITDPQSLFEAVNSRKPKDEVKVTYKRDGKEKTTKAVLGERKGSFTKSYSYKGPDGSYRTFTMPAMPRTPNPQVWNNDGQGFRGDIFMTPEMQEELNDLQMDLSMARRKKLGIKIQDTEEGNGVRILEVADSSAAATAGLKKDDVITEIAGSKVKNTDEARELLHDNQDKSSYDMKARRNNSEMNFTIKIPKKLKTANL